METKVPLVQSVRGATASRGSGLEPERFTGHRVAMQAMPIPATVQKVPFAPNGPFTTKLGSRARPKWGSGSERVPFTIQCLSRKPVAAFRLCPALLSVRRLVSRSGEMELCTMLKIIHGDLVDPKLIRGQKRPQTVKILGQQERARFQNALVLEDQQLPVLRG